LRSCRLKAEQEEYASEGIPWKDIPYTNNKPLCDLIANKPGLLSICDDCCNTAKTDSMFVMDLKSYFSANKNIQCGQNDFTVRHYAGDVRYMSEGFLTKNKGPAHTRAHAHAQAATHWVTLASAALSLAHPLSLFLCCVVLAQTRCSTT
jgi:myosin heavy subunit